MKAYTDLEQSKKLAEILPIESADMYWWYNGQKYYAETKDHNDFQKSDIPCWSLTALLQLIPKEQHPTLLVNAHYKWVCDISNPSSFTYKPASGDNPLDACVAMIEKLHEQKLL